MSLNTLNIIGLLKSTLKTFIYLFQPIIVFLKPLDVLRPLKTLNILGLLTSTLKSFLIISANHCLHAFLAQAQKSIRSQTDLPIIVAKPFDCSVMKKPIKSWQPRNATVQLAVKSVKL